MRLTAAIESTAASTVGTMIQPRLRSSAWPSTRRSRSPDTAEAAGLVLAGAGLAAARWTTGFSLPAPLPAPQNPKRIAPPPRRYDFTRLARLHSIKVAARLITRICCREHRPLAD